jgi:hypothetical protein
MHTSEPRTIPRDLESDRAQFSIRYDDLTQHAQIKLVTMQLALGRVCMEKLWSKHPLFETRRQGIAAILSRMQLESEPVAVSFGSPLEARGFIEIAHERDRSGEVSALFMNATAEIWGLPSRRDPAIDPSTRQLVRIGRAFGEHVLTKPYGPPSERKVLRFDVAGQASIPPAEHSRVRVAQNLQLPAAASALESEFSPDEVDWVFGLTHTDLNQHVNSLVYARLFEDAALRRASRLGRGGDWIADKISLCYRKPSFAGERMICMLRAYEEGEHLGAVGYLGPAGTPLDKAHCSVHLRFRQGPQ